MAMIRAANLGLRFLLELCLLAALCFWGLHSGPNLPARIGLGVGAPLLAALVWGSFIAPRATRPVRLPVRLLLEVLLFGLAAAGLTLAGRPRLALALALIYLINAALLLLWRQ